MFNFQGGLPAPWMEPAAHPPSYPQAKSEVWLKLRPVGFIGLTQATSTKHAEIDQIDPWVPPSRANPKAMQANPKAANVQAFGASALQSRDLGSD